MAIITKEVNTYNNAGTGVNGSVKCTFEVQQNIPNRYSFVRLIQVDFKSSSRTGTYYGDGEIRIGSTTQVTYSNNASSSCSVGALDTYYLLGGYPLTDFVQIQHDLSGNGSFNLVFAPRTGTSYNDFNLFYVNSTTYNAKITAQTISVTLPQIQDSLAVATPLSPVSTVEDGTAPINFVWSISNDSGTTPTGSDLQYSLNGTSWANLTHVNGSGTSYSAPANTFTAGTVYWRVCAYNRDGVAGNWSAAVSFIVVAAPAAPDVFCDEKPFATITWQSTGQQAYRLSVDGKAYGPYFGTAKVFTLADPLADGAHSISVEVQGSYGLWSEAGLYIFTVINVPGDAVALTGVFGIDAALSWTTDSTTADFLIYRDGVRIGHTAGDSFTDRLAVGSHSYKVVNRLASGYYTASNIVTGAPAAQNLAVAAFDGGAWVNLPLTEKSDSEQNFAYTRDVSLRHYTGAAYPVLEVSPFKDRTGSYDCAFLTEAEAAPLMALLGRRVIVKSRGDNLLVGPLASITKVHGDFYVAYRFQVPACHYEDFVDDA